MGQAKEDQGKREERREREEKGEGERREKREKRERLILLTEGKTPNFALYP